MFNFLITYDFKSTHPQPYSAVLKRANDFGLYMMILANDGTKGHLPNTTLHGQFPEIAGAVSAFDATLAAAARDINAQIILTRRAIVQYTNGIFISETWYPNS